MIVVIILIWCAFNTILWIKSCEPYSFKVHFFFILYAFSNSLTFDIWYRDFRNKIYDIISSERYYQDNYIKKYIFERLKSVMIKDIQIRRKDAYYIYIYTNEEVYDVVITQLELKLTEEMHKQIKIHICR